MTTISFEKEKPLETKPDISIVNLVKVLYDREDKCDRIDISLIHDDIHSISFKFDGKVQFSYVIEFTKHVENSFETRFSKVVIIKKVFRTIYKIDGLSDYHLVILTLKVEDNEQIELDLYYG